MSDNQEDDEFGFAGSEDEGLGSVDNDLEPSPASDGGREEAYRERKDAELEHEKKQDEGIMTANRRAVVAGILGGSAVGGGILYGIWDQSGKDIEGSRQPTPGNGNGQSGPPEPKKTETPEPSNEGYSPALEEIELTDKELKEAAEYARDEHGEDDLYRELLSQANDDGYHSDQKNRFEWKNGNPILETSVEGDEFYERNSVNEEIFRIVEEYAEGGGNQ